MYLGYNLFISQKTAPINASFVGLCDNGKTYISIMFCKIISINNGAFCLYLGFYNSKNVLCNNLCYGIYNNIWRFTIILIIKFIIFISIMNILSRLSFYLNYRTALFLCKKYAVAFGYVHLSKLFL